jgi:hypothetical protein
LVASSAANTTLISVIALFQTPCIAVLAKQMAKTSTRNKSMCMAISGGGLYFSFGPVDPAEEQTKGPEVT